MKLVKFIICFASLHFCCSNQSREDAMVKYLSTNDVLRGKAEIVFLLDRSASVGAVHFEDEKEFVESFLSHIVVDVNATRVAVISYSDTAERHIDYLRDPKNKSSLSQELQNVVYKDSGATNISAALEEAYDVFKNARPLVNKVLVLISHSLATSGGNPVLYADRLKMHGVEIFCFGIRRALEPELEKLASSKEHVYCCTGFRELNRLARKIRGGRMTPRKMTLMLRGFYLNGSCHDERVQRQIKRVFLNNLSMKDEERKLCVLKGIQCSFDAVKVNCGQEKYPLPRERHRRQVWEFAEKEELELEFEITINADQELNDTEAVLQNFLETIKDLDWELNEDLDLQTTTFGINSNDSYPNNTFVGKLVFTEGKALFECKPGAILNSGLCDICEPGTFSESGMAPCTPCLVAYYQSSSGQTECLECPANLSTVSIGSKNISDCIDLDPCSIENVCQNGGRCNRVGRSAICSCLSGYEGEKCENDRNECEQQPLFNDGYCVNADGSFSCNCSKGFSGSLCENKIDECLSSPCLNGGTCFDKVNDYECLCEIGYEGTNCEAVQKECYDDIICLNGGSCVSYTETNSSYCECEEGYKGIDCSMLIDYCENVTCLNNGSCESGLCYCVDGFTGLDCEKNTDDCLGNQCSYGSTCSDLVGAYKCICQPGFSGFYCDVKLDDNFILNFPESSATNANIAITTLKSPMSDVTVSMWVQTTDTNHAGTPLSYAVATTNDGTGNVIENALTISDCSGLRLYVNNETLITDVHVADGKWHHLAFTWSSENSGKWELYKDGELQSEGGNLQPNSSINGGGTIVIGQEQIGGGFSSKGTFVGNITRVNVWSSSFSKSNITRLCNSDDDIPGKVIAWPDFLDDLRGNISIFRNEKPTSENNRR